MYLQKAYFPTSRNGKQRKQDKKSLGKVFFVKKIELHKFFFL
jgi:hypothetical protein